MNPNPSFIIIQCNKIPTVTRGIRVGEEVTIKCSQRKLPDEVRERVR